MNGILFRVKVLNFTSYICNVLHLSNPNINPLAVDSLFPCIPVSLSGSLSIAVWGNCGIRVWKQKHSQHTESLRFPRGNQISIFFRDLPEDSSSTLSYCNSLSNRKLMQTKAFSSVHESVGQANVKHLKTIIRRLRILPFVSRNF